jgi:hypothetical protein
MKNEYAELIRLRERERASSQVLIGALKDALLELDTMVPLSKDALSPTFTNVREGWLSPDSTVTIIDSSGAKTSYPLETLPSHTIASALQDCAVKLNELMSQKLDSMARSVDFLERAVWELKSDGKPSDHPAPPSAAPQEQPEKEEPQKVEDKGGPSFSERLMRKKSGKGDSDRFAYSGEFKGKQGPPLVGTLPETKGNHASTSS